MPCVKHRSTHKEQVLAMEAVQCQVLREGGSHWLLAEHLHKEAYFTTAEDTLKGEGSLHGRGLQMRGLWGKADTSVT